MVVYSGYAVCSSSSAISAVYDQMQEKRKHSDNTDLMIQLHDIVSEYINVLDPSVF
jgi:hypothetical protein